MSDTVDFYEILGITQQADTGQIKRAYASKVRQYPAEQYPEQFQLIRQAYEILSNEQLKKQYDNKLNQDELSHGEREQIETILKEERYQSAVTFCENLLRKYPNNNEVKLNLYTSYMYVNRFDDALKIMRELVAYDPTDASYQLNLGVTYFELKRFNEAAEVYSKLVTMYPEEATYCLYEARCHMESNSKWSAINVLEKWLSGKRVNLSHFPVLAELYQISFTNVDASYRNEIKNRIRALAINDDMRERLCEMLIQVGYTWQDNTVMLADIAELIDEINDDDFERINDWLDEAESHLDELDQSQSAASSHTGAARSNANASSSTYNNNNASTNSSNRTTSDEPEESKNGNILVSIIIGIIFSFILTPLGGIICGFIWYFFADKIIKLISCLGCLVVVLVVAGIVLSNM